MDLTSILSLLAFGLSGLSAGILSGLFGVGGGALIVPLLLLLGISIKSAVVMSLVYILFASLSGSVRHWKQGNIQLKTTAILSLSSGLGIYLGVKVSLGLSESTLAFLFAAFMGLVLTLFGLRQHLNKQAEAKEQDGDKSYSAFQIWGGLLFTGLLAGFCSSIFGVGGGFIIVPLLVLTNPLTLKQATGTSLATIFFIALAGVAQHLVFGEAAQQLPAQAIPLTCLIIGGLFGAPVGAKLNQRWSEKTLQRGFIVFTILIMLYMLANAWLKAGG